MKLCVFFLLANLPFLTITHLVGIDTFMDSFKHPDSYDYIKNDILSNRNGTIEYLIIEKPTEQEFSVDKGDQILFHGRKTNLQQRTISQIQSVDGIITYYTTTSDQSNHEEPIYADQIIGKIIGNTQDNLWNTVCLQLWELSIHQFNTLKLFSSI